MAVLMSIAVAAVEALGVCAGTSDSFDSVPQTFTMNMDDHAGTGSVQCTDNNRQRTAFVNGIAGIILDTVKSEFEVSYSSRYPPEENGNYHG